MNYEIPFTYPEDIEAAYVIGLLKKHSVEIDAQTSWCTWPGSFILTGTFENLVEFFHDLDGSAQSFPIDEFREYIQEWN